MQVQFIIVNIVLNCIKNLADMISTLMTHVVDKDHITQLNLSYQTVPIHLSCAGYGIAMSKQL
jgi:hypothetical protein